MVRVMYNVWPKLNVLYIWLVIIFKNSDLHYTIIFVFDAISRRLGTGSIEGNFYFS